MNEDQQTRCPRTADDVAALLNNRPDGWEFLLYGGVLYVERKRLEDRYRDHVLGFAELVGDPLTFPTALTEVGAAFDDVQANLSILMNMFDADRHERAFGRPGEPGDADLIQHLGRRTVDGYAQMMQWSRRLRSMRVPADLQELFRLAASLMDQPIEQFRGYVDAAVAEFDRISETLAEAVGDPDVTYDNPLEITVELVLSVSDETLDAYADAVRRAQEAYRYDPGTGAERTHPSGH